MRQAKTNGKASMGVKTPRVHRESASLGYLEQLVPEITGGINVRVVFEDGKVYLPDHPDQKIEVPFGVQVLKLSLEGNAVFLTNPMQWLSSPTAIADRPKFISVMSIQDKECLIIDDNKTSPGQIVEVPFLVSVFSKGKIYSSGDPTLVNNPPE